jgi:hypothetical protein
VPLGCIRALKKSLRMYASKRSLADNYVKVKNESSCSSAGSL